MRQVWKRAVFLVAAAVLIVAAWKTPWPEVQTAQSPDLSAPGCTEEAGVPTGETPFYTFRDGAGNLQLELYFDPATGRGWGTRTVCRDGEEPEAVFFSFEAPGGDYAQRPGFADKDAVSAFGGGSGAELVTDYREEWAHDADGKPVQFTSWGKSREPGGEQTPVRIITVDFSYGENGRLQHKSYSHNSRIFGTTGDSVEVWYDEQERPAFASCYITHGRLEYYFLYTGEEAAESGLLYLDFFGGHAPCYAEFYWN